MPADKEIVYPTDSQISLRRCAQEPTSFYQSQEHHSYQPSPRSPTQQKPHGDAKVRNIKLHNVTPRPATTSVKHVQKAENSYWNSIGILVPDTSSFCLPPL